MTAPKDRFCDLVMKGGITSGIAFPKAVSQLSAAYRFHSIGGTSAGAIAAAVTAAAELQRRETGAHTGFMLLDRVPEELGKVSQPGSTRLFSLFQPQPGTKRLFMALSYSLNSPTTGRRWLKSIGGLLMAYWPYALIALLAGIFAAWSSGYWWSWLFPTLLAVIVCVGLRVYADLTRRLVANGYGLCTGMSEDREHPALTPMLHSLIQQAAGRAPAAPPVCFGQLWNAPLSPASVLGLSQQANPYSINLKMYSTNLTHGRPYIFPLGDPLKDVGSELFYRPSELQPYFPEPIMQWMFEKSLAMADAGNDLRSLPAAADLPILVAARMSMSFPLLISAVPLYAIDQRESANPLKKYRRCWFSDGGLSSNFPMHLFDGLVPRWPTFGISLEPRVGDKDPVFLPQKYDEGHEERWNYFGDQAAPATRLGGFFAALISVMQNWNDTSLARMPGVRDRVARLRLEADEGGLNLNMAPDKITKVSAKGRLAAELLMRRYCPPLATGSSATSALTGLAGRGRTGWDEHRFVRLNLLLEMLEQRAKVVLEALDDELAHTTSFDEIIGALASDPQQVPPGFAQPMSHYQKVALQRAVDALEHYGATLVLLNVQNKGFVAVPEPELRVRPPL